MPILLGHRRLPSISDIAHNTRTSLCERMSVVSARIYVHVNTSWWSSLTASVSVLFDIARICWLKVIDGALVARKTTMQVVGTIVKERKSIL